MVGSDFKVPKIERLSLSHSFQHFSCFIAWICLSLLFKNAFFPLLLIAIRRSIFCVKETNEIRKYFSWSWLLGWGRKIYRNWKQRVKIAEVCCLVTFLIKHYVGCSASWFSNKYWFPIVHCFLVLIQYNIKIQLHLMMETASLVA